MLNRQLCPILKSIQWLKKIFNKIRLKNVINKNF